MAKIIDPDNLRVGTELTFNLVSRAWTLIATGNLSSDGVTAQALYSKFKELWRTAPYKQYPFPMYAIDAEAGKFQFGTDGSGNNGWKPANDTTRNLIRDGGWEEYTEAGTLSRVYAGIKTPAGSVGPTDQLYYQRTPTGVAINFNFAGPVNEGVQVFGDALNGNFDERAYLKVFARIQGKTYSEKTLIDGDYTTGSGPRLFSFFVSNAADAKVMADDATVDAYGITVTYYAADQQRAIPAGGTQYPFRTIIDGKGKTAEEIYTAIQSKLRKAADIDAGAGTVLGRTAAALLSFNGEQLVTATGVYIDNYHVNDTNRITFTDKNGVARNNPFVAAGTISFNANLTADADAVYDAYYESVPNGNYGTANAVTVKDATGVAISGSVSGRSEVAFTYAYDSNTDGGKAAGIDVAVIVTAVGKSSGKFVSTRYVLRRAVGQNIALVAEKERSYLNPA